MNVRVTSLKQSSLASAWFDILRWAAASYVMVFHLRPVLYVGNTQLAKGSVVAKILYGATSLGYESVMLFFVLSGFLIGSTVLKQIQDGSWNWITYLVQRLTRLWLVLIPALVLTLAWSMFEVMLFHNKQYFGSSISWGTFLGNVLFLQGVMAPNFGQNLPLWSLTYEFWYYILFPCCVLTFYARRRVARFFYGGTAILISILIGKDIVLYFSIWLLGVVLALIPSGRFSQRLMGTIGLPLSIMLLCGTLIYGKEYITAHHVLNFDMVHAFPADFAVSIAFAIFLHVVLNTFNYDFAKPTRFRHIASQLAGFSYTLYLTHYPIINFLRKWLGNGTWGIWEPSIKNLFLGCLILGGILLYAWIVSLATEARTPQVRRFVSRLVSRIVTNVERPTSEFVKHTGGSR